MNRGFAKVAKLPRSFRFSLQAFEIFHIGVGAVIGKHARLAGREAQREL